MVMINKVIETDLITKFRSTMNKPRRLIDTLYILLSTLVVLTSNLQNEARSDYAVVISKYLINDQT